MSYNTAYRGETTSDAVVYDLYGKAVSTRRQLLYDAVYDSAELDNRELRKDSTVTL